MLPQILLETAFQDFSLEITAINSQVDPKLLILEAKSTCKNGICPKCGQVSSRIHSHYTRWLMDLPVCGQRLQILLLVKKFRCQLSTCSCKVFCERLESFTSLYSRNSNRCQQVLEKTTLLLGGLMTQRILELEGLVKSDSSLLRLIRKLPCQHKVSCELRRIGIDDFALKKGREYATVIIDLEQGKAIELLPNRNADTVAAWLKEHPSIELVTRDRSREYGLAITTGAPQAVQVLDRWHFLKNLREALERELQRHHKEIAVAVQVKGQIAALTLHSTTHEQSSILATERRKDLYQAIYTLHKAGMTNKQIQIQTEVCEHTVRRAVRYQGVVERRYNARPASILSEFMVFLQQQWDAGFHNASQLFREIKKQGFTGSQRQVLLWAQERRTTPAKTTPKIFRDSAIRNATLQTTGLPVMRLTSRATSWILFHDPQNLDADETSLLEQLKTQPILNQAQQYVQEFKAFVTQKQPSKFVDWLNRLGQSKLTDLKAFGKALEQEGKPFLAALELPWSNGPTEGVVNKIKFIKRQGYGRASFDLLRLRVLNS